MVYAKTETHNVVMRYTNCGFVFVQNLIVFAHSYAEDDRCDVLETVDPLLALRPLATDVEQSENEQ